MGCWSSFFFYQKLFICQLNSYAKLNATCTDRNFYFLFFAVGIVFFQTLVPLFLLEKHKVISAFQFLNQKYPAIHFLGSYNSLKEFLTD
ncbi:hypothetical protein DCC35_12585 [Mangrovivirga cuniculi]|uniref:Uncharacterized protein n=1 Tax=Mangrovivirga cuniculi TaxID=2715131 RepID=A0A4D7JIU8_9BACT|nr:hypothetical protein DCC35_12585 [Mangrovivirga cuniculi]